MADVLSRCSGIELVILAAVTSGLLIGLVSAVLAIVGVFIGPLGSDPFFVFFRRGCCHGRCVAIDCRDGTSTAYSVSGADLLCHSSRQSAAEVISRRAGLRPFSRRTRNDGRRLANPKLMPVTFAGK